MEATFPMIQLSFRSQHAETKAAPQSEHCLNLSHAMPTQRKHLSWCPPRTNPPTRSQSKHMGSLANDPLNPMPQDMCTTSIRQLAALETNLSRCKTPTHYHPLQRGCSTVAMWHAVIRQLATSALKRFGGLWGPHHVHRQHAAMAQSIVHCVPQHATNLSLKIPKQ